MLNAECSMPNATLACCVCLYMSTIDRQPSGKPYDIHERLLDFACDIVRTAQFLHDRGPIARALSYQLLSAGTSAGANAAEGDGASSHNDFIAKNANRAEGGKGNAIPPARMSPRGLLDVKFDPLVRNQINWSESSARSCTTPINRRNGADAASVGDDNDERGIEPGLGPRCVAHWALSIEH